ncbi:glycosyl transferase family 51 [Xylanimonas cellulosilytica DSM 15894]|uniref:Glycosyl transferase family 51 n=1 Tax=Xylanimonas cellulosilytica (strain DSM 15894 / JCM 12276 / CECT 5975 / KCTC 9989 / LMG 20990 / NBRC 107835 / XIL07) TaxID=446471 RepID=D1BRT9_XYLCX|nr:penicillin-binding protein [Xylanimonas cellulosilytica]ACZ32355.1 glycosyl transferase family 51 [Xylanimonas cellulosilytica DSM 15894]
MATSGRRQATRRRGLWNYPRRGKGPIHRWVPSWRIVVGMFVGVVALGTGTLAAAWVTTTVPDNLGDITHQTTTIFFSDGETEIGRLGARRQLVRLEDLPSYVGDAVVASEDATFWTNPGVDPRGFARALWNNLRGQPTQGGSTLTMQYIERTRTDAVSDVVGKFREAIMAVQVTQSTPKEDILEAYLNTIYWGRGVFGVEAAAQAYFGKPASELTLSEAAMLAGIIPSPNNWDPGVNEERARTRWHRNINRMYSQGLITAEQRAEAEFPEFLPRPTATNTLGGQAGFLVNEVIRELSDTDAFRDRPEQLRTRGLHIVTTIDPVLQDAAVAVAQSAFEGDHPADPDALSVSLASMDPETGEIRALFGGLDYLERQFNTATRGSAQAGSTFKPFTLIAALEDGRSLGERFDGRSQRVIPGWDPANGNQGPRNFGGRHFGSIDLVDAMADSVNTVFAQLNVEVGPERTVEVAHRLGIPESVDIPAVPSNVLGPSSVSVLDLATAYSTIANGGDRVTPHVVREVRELDGTLVHTGPTARTPEFDPQVMAAATHTLEQTVENGSGRTARELRGLNGERRPAAGKTGTSNGNVSSWFAGFVPQLVTVVGLQQERDGRLEPIEPFGQWANHRTGMTGSTFPARAWTDFMHVATEGMEVQAFPSYTPTRTARPVETPVEEPVEEPEYGDADDEQADPHAGWVTVPDGLAGQSVGQVTGTLSGLGLQSRVEVVESTQPEGTVLGVTPSGTPVPPGSTVTVRVSGGPPEPAPAPPPAPPAGGGNGGNGGNGSNGGNGGNGPGGTDDVDADDATGGTEA